MPLYGRCPHIDVPIKKMPLTILYYIFVAAMRLPRAQLLSAFLYKSIIQKWFWNPWQGFHHVTFVWIKFYVLKYHKISTEIGRIKKLKLNNTITNHFKLSCPSLNISTVYQLICTSPKSFSTKEYFSVYRWWSNYKIDILILKKRY